MTQEELDALMNGGIDDLEDDATVEDAVEEVEETIEEEEEIVEEDKTPKGYSEDTAHQWPLPATDENRMVHQLDDVTKESEEKATEIFDILDVISNDLMEKEESVSNVLEVLNENIKLFTTLSEKFPDIEAFKTSLEQNQQAITELDETTEVLQNGGDSIMNIMDIMQYQDIHRQKIERVINVMRALSRYMNTLFEGKIADEHRVSSAQHIAGDTHNDLASDDDIEALLDQFAK